MALKGDREIYQDNIKYTCPSAATAGDILVISTAGSGVALGDTAGAADLVSNPSGYKVAGMLLHDVVSIDETRFHRNFHNGEVKTGERVRLLRKGVVTTDSLKSGDTPTDGDVAYLTLNGEITKTMSSTGGLVATPKVGEFRGKKDANAFVCVEISLPIV